MSTGKRKKKKNEPTNKLDTTDSNQAAHLNCLTHLTKTTSPKCVPAKLQNLQLSSIHDTRLINQLDVHIQSDSPHPYSQNVDNESYSKPIPTSS